MCTPLKPTLAEMHKQDKQRMLNLNNARTFNNKLVITEAVFIMYMPIWSPIYGIQMVQKIGRINLLRQNVGEIEFTLDPVRRNYACSYCLMNILKRESNILFRQVSL